METKRDTTSGFSLAQAAQMIFKRINWEDKGTAGATNVSVPETCTALCNYTRSLHPDQPNLLSMVLTISVPSATFRGQGTA